MTQNKLHYTKLKILSSFINNTSSWGSDTKLSTPENDLHRQRNAATVALEEYVQNFWCIYSGDCKQNNFNKIRIGILDLQNPWILLFDESHPTDRNLRSRKRKPKKV